MPFSGYCIFRLERLQIIAFSGWSIFRLERYHVRALSGAIFSSFAKNGFCRSQVIAFSGYGIFRLEHFLVIAFSGSAKKKGFCIFRYAIFSHPPESRVSALYDIAAQSSFKTKRIQNHFSNLWYNCTGGIHDL
jgi:hypothetical protein